MAKYENVEKISELLDENQLGNVLKKLSATEKNLSEILKNLTVLEEQKAAREAAEAAARAEEEARIAALEAAKAAEEAAKKAAEEEAKKAQAAIAETEEKPKKKTTKKKATPETEAEAPVEPAEETTVAETPAVETPSQEVVKEEKQAETQAPKAEKPVLKTFVPKAEPAAPRAPRYFRNGQVQGEYVAKPGTEASTSSTSYGGTYRPRTEGARVPRGQGRPADTTGGARTPRVGGMSGMGGAMSAPVMPTKEGKSFSAPAKKKTFEKTYTEKKALSKRDLIRQQGLTVEDFDEDKSGYRKVRSPKKQKRQEIPTIKIEHAIVTTQEIPLKVLSEKLGVSAVEITKRLFKEGIMKGINDSIDYDNAALMAADMGIDLEYKPEKTAEEVLMANATTEDVSKLVPRAPVVTVMGHVDHGKTSLLDAIRSTSVTSGEAGGITQSIGAYTVTAKGKQITFIDTPGHAAFTAMRARGAQVTDIVILVVAADDGIMPQTVEAINHAKAANVPIIVAMNKMDKYEVSPDRVKQELMQHELVPEEWGGDTMVVPISAKTGMGIDDLLDSVNLVAEMQELKADPDRQAKGTIIEAKLDKGKGPVASIIVQTGTLKTGDNILSGTTMGRVRAMFDDKGKPVKSAGPSMAVSILGLEDVPNAGDSIMAVD